MNSLTKLIDERAAISKIKAGKAAAEASTHSGSVAYQARAETALTDYAHYVSLQAMISQQQNSMYHENSTRSFFSDLVASHRSDRAASHRPALGGRVDVAVGPVLAERGGAPAGRCGRDAQCHRCP